MQHDAVLIIDDDPSICQFISRVCSRSGFDPVIASNPGDFAMAIRNRSLLPDGRCRPPRFLPDWAGGAVAAARSSRSAGGC